MAKDIDYSVVKAEDITEAMKASSKSVNANRTKANADNVVWNQTVTVLMERVDPKDVARDTTKEGIKKNRELLQGIMANHIMAVLPEIPRIGKNRQGKDFEIEGKNGIQWSSWSDTQRIWDYCGSVAKVLSFGHENVLYPEKFKVAGRCAVLELCKEGETPIAGVRRLTKDLQGRLDLMTDTSDVIEAQKLTSALVVNNLDLLIEAQDLINKLDGLIEAADDSEKTDIQAVLLRMATKHFA